mgnify:CR=1 FL=1
MIQRGLWALVLGVSGVVGCAAGDTGGAGTGGGRGGVGARGVRVHGVGAHGVGHRVRRGGVGAARAIAAPRVARCVAAAASTSTSTSNRRIGQNFVEIFERVVIMRLRDDLIMQISGAVDFENLKIFKTESFKLC